MKKVYMKFVLITAAFLVIAPSVWGQQNFADDPRYGDTPEERTANVLTLNNLRNAYTAGDYDKALVLSKTIIEKLPRYSTSTFQYAANIYKRKIGSAQGDDRNKYVDSLMMIYDTQMEFHGDNPTQGVAFITKTKANDYYMLRPDDIEKVRSLYNEAIETSKNDPVLINQYFQILVSYYGSDAIETDVLLDEYDRLLNLVADDDKSVMESLLLQSGAANCENLEKIYRPQIAANPDSVELLERVFGTLGNRSCRGDFMVEIGAAIYKIKPTSGIAMFLAEAYQEKNDIAKANEYLVGAMDSEEDPIMKSNLAVRLAAADIATKPSAAVAMARRAIDYNPENGIAYWTMASAFISASTGCTGLSQKAVFWVAADNLIKARNLLSNSPDKAEELKKVNEELARCPQYFPTKEDVFLVLNLEDGAPYQVRCGWINERTVIRTVQ